MAPPKPPRPGSSPRLSITEEVAPGAVRQYRPPSFADRPTVPPPSERRPAISNRPPPDMHPMPPAYRREPAEDNPSNAIPRARPAERHQTLTGMPAPPSVPPQREKLDSIEVANGTLLDELAEKSEELRAAQADRDRLASELERSRRAPTLPEDAPTRAMWHALAFKLMGVLALLGAAATAWIEVHTIKVDQHVDTVEGQQRKTKVTVEDRLKELEKHDRIHERWQRCMYAELASATERGTGHKVEGEHDDVQWVEQNAPRAPIRPLWHTPPWSIDKEQGCGPEPAPPVTPAELPP